MKEQFIVYNPYINKYIFYEGPKQKNRKEFSINNTKEIKKNLEKLVDKKRNTILYVQNSENNIIEFIKKYYKGTKVKVVTK